MPKAESVSNLPEFTTRALPSSPYSMTRRMSQWWEPETPQDRPQCSWPNVVVPAPFTCWSAVDLDHRCRIIWSAVFELLPIFPCMRVRRSRLYMASGDWRAWCCDAREDYRFPRCSFSSAWNQGVPGCPTQLHVTSWVISSRVSMRCNPTVGL